MIEEKIKDEVKEGHMEEEPMELAGVKREIQEVEAELEEKLKDEVKEEPVDRRKKRPRIAVTDPYLC